MELLQLKYFKTVAEIGKISEAAKALFISAPALSTSITRLEREMGMALFDRSNNKITLNQQGQIFLRYVNQVFSTLDCAKVEMQQSLYLQGRHVFIASVSSTPWVDLVTNFAQEYPDFTLSCTSVGRSDLRDHGMPSRFNFLLASSDDIPAYFEASLDHIDLYQDEPLVMVHKDHPFANRESISLREIVNEPIFLPMQDFDLYKHLVILFDRCGIPFPGGNAYSLLATQQLVSKNLGIGFTSKAIVRTPTLPVKYIPISEPCPPWMLRLYWRKDQVFSEDEAIFKAFVEKEYAAAH